MKITKAIINAIKAATKEIEALKLQAKQEKRSQALASPRRHFSRRIADRRREVRPNLSAMPGVPAGFGIARLLSDQ